MKRVLFLMLIFIIMITGCVAQGEDEDLYTGTIEAEETNISSEVAGTIIEISVKEGQRVKAGDIVAQLDTSDLEIQLEKAKTSLKLANANLQEILNGARSEEIKNARANLNNIQALIEGAKKDYQYRTDNYNDLRKLYANGAISKQQLEDAEALVDSSLTKLESLQKQYESAKASLELLINGATKESIKKANANVELAKKDIEYIENQIRKTKILAYKNGIVQTVNFNEGEIIQMAGVVANTMDLKNLWVKIYVPEKKLHLISLGKEIELLTDFKKDIIKGKVIYISNEAEFTPKNVESKENKEEMVFEVKISILDRYTELKPGMLLNARLRGDS